MRVGTIYYNMNTDTTEVKWNDDFVVASYITKADVLKDLRGILWMAYDYVHDHHDNADGGDGYIPQNIGG